MWLPKKLQFLVPGTPPEPPIPPLTPPRGPGGPKMAKMHSLKSIDDNLCQKSHFWGVKKIDLFFHSECTYKKTAILCGREFEVSKTTIISKHAFVTLKIMYTSQLWSCRLYNIITLLSFSALYSHLSCERFARINSDVALTRPSTDNGFSLIKDQGRRRLSCPSHSQLSSKSSKELSSSHSLKKSHLFWCQPVLGNHNSIISSCDLRAWLSTSSASSNWYRRASSHVNYHYHDHPKNWSSPSSDHHQMVPEASSKFLTDDLKFEMLDWQIMGRGEQKQKRDSLDSKQCGKVGSSFCPANPTKTL